VFAAITTINDDDDDDDDDVAGPRCGSMMRFTLRECSRG